MEDDLSRIAVQRSKNGFRLADPGMPDHRGSHGRGPGGLAAVGAVADHFPRLSFYGVAVAVTWPNHQIDGFGRAHPLERRKVEIPQLHKEV